MSARQRPELVLVTAVGGGNVMPALQRELRALGWRVARVEAVPFEAYRRAKALGGLRLWQLRCRVYLLFPCQLLWRALCAQRGTVFLATTNPFFAPVLLQGLRRLRGYRVVQILYDLYPDALLVQGRLGEGAPGARVLAGLTRFGLRNCAATVFLGEQLKRSIQARYGPARQAWVIPVGADAAGFPAAPEAPGAGGSMDPGAIVTLLYSGQWGALHRAPVLEAFWAQCVCAAQPVSGERALQFTFAASGAGYTAWVERLKARGCTPGATLWTRWQGLAIGWSCTGTAEAEVWRARLLASPVGLVTVAAGAEDVLLPSKLYSALLAGQALLVLAQPESDAARLVEAHGCGWVLPPRGEPEALGAVLRDLLDLAPEQLGALRRRALEAGRMHYRMDAVARLWHHHLVRALKTEREVSRG